jgi:ABC-2 type transport system permease protein
MALVYLFSLLSLGLFVSTKTTTQASAQQLAQMFLLPSIFLSGYIFPFEGLPWLLKAVGYVLPATHMVRIMRGVVLRDAGPLELMPQALALILISTILVGLSVRTFKKVAT